jgi:hypothetical protein
MSQSQKDLMGKTEGELQKLTWPNTPILLNVDNNSVSSEDDSGDSQPASGTAESGVTSSEEISLEEDIKVAVPSDSAKEPVVGDNEDEDDHQVAGTISLISFHLQARFGKRNSSDVWYWGNSCTRHMSPRACCKVEVPNFCTGG